MRERKATRVRPLQRDFIPGPFRVTPSTISQLSFPSLPRFFFFFSFDKRRVGEEPRRGIVSLEYIQITGGAESHRRFVGVPAIISQVALSRATSSIPPFCWINLLVVYVPSTFSLPPSIYPLSLHSSLPFLPPLQSSGPTFLYFFPFCVASLFHFLDFPSSTSFLLFSPSAVSLLPHLIIPSSLRNRVIKHRASRRNIKASAQASRGDDEGRGVRPPERRRHGGGSFFGSDYKRIPYPVLDEEGFREHDCCSPCDPGNTSNSCVRFYCEVRVTQPA